MTNLLAAWRFVLLSWHFVFFVDTISLETCLFLANSQQKTLLESPPLLVYVMPAAGLPGGEDVKLFEPFRTDFN